MFTRTKLYTIHEHPGAPDPADQLVLVREGFSFTAFIFHLFWLLYHRLWLPALAYLVLLAALGAAEEMLGLGPISLGALQLLLQLLLGFTAYDLKRWALTRKAYTCTGVVSGESELTAERRYYDAIA